MKIKWNSIALAFAISICVFLSVNCGGEKSGLRQNDGFPFDSIEAVCLESYVLPTRDSIHSYIERLVFHYKSDSVEKFILEEPFLFQVSLENPELTRKMLPFILKEYPLIEGSRLLVYFYMYELGDKCLLGFVWENKSRLSAFSYRSLYQNLKNFQIDSLVIQQ